MGWYTCRTCKHEFHSGLFKVTYCPKCWGKFSQTTSMIKRLIKILILPAIVMAVLFFVAQNLFAKITNVAIAALDTTTLYAYSKDAYLESIIRGRQGQRYYTITAETPYYSSILSHAKLETAEPLGVLPRGVVVELRSVIRKGEHVWIPAFFYNKDKVQQAFALFPRDWEENVRPFDWDERVIAIKNTYETTIKNNFELMQVKREDEKEYREKYNDYYKVRDITGGDGDILFYAQRTDKSRIDNVFSYYMNANNINMVILQTDLEWERPQLIINKAEENE